MIDEKILQEYIEAVDFASTGSQGAEQLKPFNAWRLFPIYSHISLERLFRLIEKIECEKINYEDLVKIIQRVAGWRYELGLSIVEAKLKRVSVVEREKIFNFFYKILKEKTIDDSFSRHGHYLKDKKDINKILNKHWFECEKNEILKKEIGMINGLLLGYLYSKYTDNFVNLGMETEGPYRTEEGSLVVRKVHDYIKGIGYLEIYTIYDTSNIRINMFNQIVTNENLKDKTKKVIIEVNEEAIKNLNEVSMLKKNIERTTILENKMFNEKNFEEHKQNLVLIREIELEKIFNKFGIELRREDIFNSIASKELIEEFDNSYFDARTDFKQFD